MYRRANQNLRERGSAPNQKPPFNHGFGYFQMRKKVSGGDAHNARARERVVLKKVPPEEKQRRDVTESDLCKSVLTKSDACPLPAVSQALF